MTAHSMIDGGMREARPDRHPADRWPFLVQASFPYGRPGWEAPEGRNQPVVVTDTTAEAFELADEYVDEGAVWVTIIDRRNGGVWLSGPTIDTVTWAHSVA